jgi:hypothetical protein
VFSRLLELNFYLRAIAGQAYVFAKLARRRTDLGACPEARLHLKALKTPNTRHQFEQTLGAAGVVHPENGGGPGVRLRTRVSLKVHYLLLASMRAEEIWQNDAAVGGRPPTAPVDREAVHGVAAPHPKICRFGELCGANDAWTSAPALARISGENRT